MPGPLHVCALPGAARPARVPRHGRPRRRIDLRRRNLYSREWHPPAKTTSMSTEHDAPVKGCRACLQPDRLDIDFGMAFQPIVDVSRGAVFAYEALVRSGPHADSAREVFAAVNGDNRYWFDQTCRTRAIGQAAALGMQEMLSINFMPNAVYQPERCIRTTLQAAEEHGFPMERIIFEITESERVDDLQHLRNIVEHYQRRGFKTAIDDFGAGYSGLNLLAQVPTDLIKLDAALIRDIHASRAQQAIVKGILRVCEELDIVPIAEGIENEAELRTLRDFGIELFQGYHFAPARWNALPGIE